MMDLPISVVRVRDAYLYLSLSQPQSVLPSSPSLVPQLQLLSPPPSLFSQQHCGVEGYDELIACGAILERFGQGSTLQILYLW